MHTYFLYIFSQYGFLCPFGSKHPQKDKSCLFLSQSAKLVCLLKAYGRARSHTPPNGVAITFGDFQAGFFVRLPSQVQNYHPTQLQVHFHVRVEVVRAFRCPSTPAAGQLQAVGGPETHVLDLLPPDQDLNQPRLVGHTQTDEGHSPSSCHPRWTQCHMH